MPSRHATSFQRLIRRRQRCIEVLQTLKQRRVSTGMYPPDSSHERPEPPTISIHL